MVLAPTRQRLIRAQRYLIPQLDAIEALMRRSEAAGVETMLCRADIVRLRESEAKLRSLVSALEATRGSGDVLHDELMDIKSEQNDNANIKLARVGVVLSGLAILSISMDLAHFLNMYHIIDVAKVVKELGLCYRP